VSRFVAVALALGGRYVRNWLASPAVLVSSFAFPLFFFAAFAGGLSRIADAPGFDYPAGYTTFQFVFVVLQASAFIGAFTGFAIAVDFETGFGRRLFLAAPNRLGILAGYALGAVFRTVAIIAVLQIVALVAGMQVEGGLPGIGGLYLLALLVSLGSTLFAAGIALRSRTVQSAPAMQLPIFILLFLAPVYVPRELLHDWIKTAADLNPFTPIVEAGRSFLAGTDAETLLAYAAAAGLLVLMLLWALRGLRKAEAAGA
jgi:ABC-2 type transport system permease protein